MHASSVRGRRIVLWAPQVFLETRKRGTPILLFVFFLSVNPTDSNMMSTKLQTIRPAKLVSAPVSRRVTLKSPTVSVTAQKSFVEGLINNLTVAIQSSPLAEGKKALAIAQAGSYDEAAVKAEMEGLISSNPVMIFSFSTCPFCKNAKKLLDDMDVAYKAVELNEMDGGMAIRAELAKRTGRTSMPNIWVGGEGIGGFNDGPGLKTLQKNGELFKMLEKAGAVKASDPLEKYCEEDPSADECRVYED